jgi:hypothetical protein
MNFTIKGSLPSMNEIIDMSKSHWSNYRKMKEDYTNLVAWSIPDKKPMKRVNIYITWYCKDKRQDKDNIAAGTKFILDGIVQAGVLKNDGWKEIGDIYHRFQVDKKNPRILVRLVEI